MGIQSEQPVISLLRMKVPKEIFSGMGEKSIIANPKFN